MKNPLSVNSRVSMKSNCENVSTDELMSLGGNCGNAAPCGRERFHVSMQGQYTLYGIANQGAITTASELSGMVSKDRSRARATQSHTERN